MSEVFFISDLHIGHKAIINFDETRPFRQFSTIEEHDEEIINRWNNVVSKKDTVWLLGDAVFGKRNLFKLGRLNGIIKLVMGNHDIYASDEYLKYVHKLYGVVEYKGMVLSHMPISIDQNKRYYLNVHGHLHTREINNPWYVNVSAEKVNLTPIPIDEIHNLWSENKDKYGE